MIKCVVFDWNGTLLADTKQAVDAFNKICKDFNKRPISIKKYRDTMDIPVIELYLKNGFTEKEIRTNGKKIQALFLKYYSPKEDKARLRKGVRHTLNWLLNKGIDIVLISNHNQDRVERQLSRLKIDTFFSHVFCNTNNIKVLNRRFKGDKMIEYVKRQGYKKNEVINVGDAPEEVHMARDAEVMSVAISEGFYSTKRIKLEKPDYIITHMEQLINIVNRTNK
jgi:phosphoglycolate phosphatase-like HAD superfamily hydrolase